jgi:transposase
MNPILHQPSISPAVADVVTPLLAHQDGSAAVPKAQPRLRRADREVVVPAMRLEDLLTPEHHARTVWRFVEGLDLTSLLDAIHAVEGGPGRPATDPRILMAVWLYATVEGVGSARALDWLCVHHHGFRWLCGGVSVNYHSLADFRVAHLEFLDELLTSSVAVLMAENLVDLNRVAQDGMRVRASAGAASFRRRPTLEHCLEEAQAQVQRLRVELETDPAAANRRQHQARERAAREREERIRQALARMPELEAKKKAEDKGKARVSTTDAEATVMKMADGGFRPAYNFQFSTTTSSQIIVAVDVTTSGSDQGQMTPQVQQIQERYGQPPKEVLIDGGFAAHADMESVSAPERGCTVYAPVPQPKKAGVDRYAPHAGDGPAVAEWRRRMATSAAQQIYKDRAATAECVNALARQRGLRQLSVRGRLKAKAIALWYAIAHNLLRAVSLRAALAGVG